MLDNIEAAIMESLVQTVTAGALRMAAIARSKAPVRHIFSGDARIIRARSIEETFLRTSRGVTGYISDEVTSGYKVRYPHRIAMRRLSVRDLPSRLNPEAEDLLDRRGRYEVHHGRANYRPAHRAYQSGGRLKGEIHATRAQIDGREVVAEVVSPTPYAEYQEFGTRHNAAHPYMRPARDESIGGIRDEIAAGAVAAGRRGIGQIKGRPIEIELTVVK